MVTWERQNRLFKFKDQREKERIWLFFIFFYSLTNLIIQRFENRFSVYYWLITTIILFYSSYRIILLVLKNERNNLDEKMIDTNETNEFKVQGIPRKRGEEL